MERGLQTKEAPRIDTARMYRALAALALLPSCFLAGCAGEQSNDINNSPSPYSSETTTPQTENDSNKNLSEEKKERENVIDLSKNSIYYSEDSVREGFTAFCQHSEYNVRGIADCSIYLCDGSDLVRLEFKDIDFIEETQGKTPSISNLLDKTDVLYARHRYPSTEITEDLDKCREKSDSVGEFTEAVPHIIDENEQYMCLPQFMTTKDGEKVALEIKKITSADKKKNTDYQYPQYELDLSANCFDLRYLE